MRSRSWITKRYGCSPVTTCRSPECQPGLKELAFGQNPAFWCKCWLWFNYFGSASKSFARLFRLLRSLVLENLTLRQQLVVLKTALATTKAGHFRQGFLGSGSSILTRVKTAFDHRRRPVASSRFPAVLEIHLGSQKVIVATRHPLHPTSIMRGSDGFAHRTRENIERRRRKYLQIGEIQVKPKFFDRSQRSLELVLLMIIVR
jgi:hypothetical protein